MKRLMWTAFALPFLTTLLTAAPAKDEQAEAEAILDKAIKAVGGEERISKLTSFTEKSRSKYWWPPKGEPGIMTVELAYDFPRRLRVLTVIDADQQIDCIINAGQGWIGFSGNWSELTDEQIAREKDMLEEGLLTNLGGIRQLPLLKGKGYKLTPLGDSKIGDRRGVGIKVSREGQSDIELYFDRDTSLPLKRSWLRKEPPTPNKPSLEPDKWEVLFDDYKEVGGVKYPAKQTMFRNDKKTGEGTITELKIVEKFDDKVFAKPE